MKPAVILASHIAIGLVGWGIAREFNRPDIREKPDNTRIRSGSSPVRGLAAGARMIASISSSVARDEAAEKTRLASRPDPRVEILAAMRELKLPADPAAEIRTLMNNGEESDIKAAALFVLWARSDGAAALMFASGDEDFRKMDHDDEALELVGESIKPEAAFDMATGLLRDPVFRGLAKQLIPALTIGELAELIREQEPDTGRTLAFHIAKQWPGSRLDDFGQLVTEMRDAGMIEQLGDDLNRLEVTKWLMRYVDQHADPEFAAEIRESPTYFLALRDEPGIPLKERLAGMTKRKWHGSGPPIESLAENDIKFPKDGPDIHHAFHHGKVEAAELLSELSARFPEYAAAGLVPRYLYRQLASHDPERAAVLLQGLSDVERSREIVAGMYPIPSLDTFLKILRNFPQSDDGAVLAARSECWSRYTDHGLDNYGREYLQWIATLPDPQDRKMALEAIKDRIEGSFAWNAEEIREIVGEIPLSGNP